jgi:TRAP-type mannitol/chloroaromatic compound transport system permease small subunit
LGEFGVDLMLRLSRAIDAVNLRIGKSVAWLIVAAVLVSAINAVLRKTLNISSNAWLELQWILFSMVFLWCAAWTLLANEHIRIDIVNNMFPNRVRHWIDVLGHAFFLLPFTVVMLITGWPFFFASFRINEQSGNAGGLPQWPAKILIPTGFFLLFLQGISELIKRIAVMQGRIPDPHAVHHPREEVIEQLVEVIEKR